MSVEIDICVSALIKLGAEPINSFDDNSKEARLCRIQYPKIRDSILHTAPWNFAVKRVSLTPSTNNLAFDNGENVFQLPVDCVRVWKTNDPRHISYRLESGRKLISAVDVLEVFYVSNTVPVNDYSGSFKEAVACALAADLCYSLTQSQSLKQSLLSESDTLINLARSSSSQEQTPENFEFDDFINARRGGHEILY